VKTPRIVVVDLAMGNLRSAAKGLERQGARVTVSDRPSSLRSADAIVLPGDGAFAAAMRKIRSDKWLSPLQGWIGEGRPLFGICLGMQLLFEESLEFGRTKGLGAFPGRVVPFPRTRRVPHMGWNTIRPARKSWLTKGLPSPAWMYFVHSFYPQPSDSGCIAATTDYGMTFCSVAENGAVAGAQFHPEKSQKAGTVMLRNFVDLVRRQG